MDIQSLYRTIFNFTRIKTHFLFYEKSKNIVDYPVLNQTTILIKGRPSLVKKDSVKYNYGEQNVSSHLFELKVESIDLSELNPNSRNEQGIIREIEKIYPTKKGKRQILLNNDLDDIQEYMLKKHFSPSLL